MSQTKECEMCKEEVSIKEYYNDEINKICKKCKDKKDKTCEKCNKKVSSYQFLEGSNICLLCSEPSKKNCKMCENIKLCDNFVKDRLVCKECKKIQSNNNIKNKKNVEINKIDDEEVKIITTIKYKICSTCEKNKDSREYSKGKDAKSKICFECKDNKKRCYSCEKIYPIENFSTAEPNKCYGCDNKKTCNICLAVKDISDFEPNRAQCEICRNNIKKNNAKQYQYKDDDNVLCDICNNTFIFSEHFNRKTDRRWGKECKIRVQQNNNKVDENDLKAYQRTRIKRIENVGIDEYRRHNRNIHANWIQQNPEYIDKYKVINSYKISKIKAGAKQRNIYFNEEDKDEMIAKLSDNCLYCGYLDEELLNGLDRVNNEAGYTDINTVPCCFLCNHIKSNEGLFSFFNKVDKIVQNNINLIEEYKTNDKYNKNIYQLQEITPRSKNFSTKIKNKEYSKKFNNTECYICGIKYDIIGCDRKDSNLDYKDNLENQYPCCSMCNYMKSDYKYLEFIIHCYNITNNIKIVGTEYFKELNKKTKNINIKHEKENTNFIINDYIEDNDCGSTDILVFHEDNIYIPVACYKKIKDCEKILKIENLSNKIKSNQIIIPNYVFIKISKNSFFEKSVSKSLNKQFMEDVKTHLNN